MKTILLAQLNMQGKQTDVIITILMNHDNTSGSEDFQSPTTISIAHIPFISLGHNFHSSDFAIIQEFYQSNLGHGQHGALHHTSS
jgi:hypothetical protein